MAFDQAFSTLPLRPDERVARWTEAASDRFVDIGFQIRTPECFAASMQHRELNELSVTRIVSAGHERKHITRSLCKAASASEEFFLVSLQVEGSCWLAQGGRETLLQPGQFAIYDTRRPYELLLDGDYEQVVLRVPRRTLGARLPGCDELTATTVGADSASAQRLRQSVRAAIDPPSGWSPRAAEGQAAIILRALGGGLRGLQTGEAADVPRSRAEQLDRIKAHVLRHLADTRLGVASVASALGLSVSYLHQVFRAEGCTLERWIWARRLAACADALRAPDAVRRTLTEIAHAHGFSDAAHFSRSFARAYGATPSRYRAMVGLKVPAADSCSTRRSA